MIIDSWPDKYGKNCLVKGPYGFHIVYLNNYKRNKSLSIQSCIDKQSFLFNKYKGYCSNYSTFVKSKIKTNCRIHGTYEKTLGQFAVDSSCKFCNDEVRTRNNIIRNHKGKFTNKLFINKCKKIHNNYYSYLNTIYKGCTNKVNVICPEHGSFSILASNHLAGKGCPTCGNILQQLNYSALKNKLERLKEAENVYCKLYLVELYNSKERFLKVGITNNSVVTRTKEFTNYDIIQHLVLEDNLNKIIELEQNIHKNKNFKKYIPLNKFGGYTECYDLSELDNLKTNMLIITP